MADLLPVIEHAVEVGEIEALLIEALLLSEHVKSVKRAKKTNLHVTLYSGRKFGLVIMLDKKEAR